MYGVIGSTTKKIKKLYGAISSTTKGIKKVYGVVGGVTKLIYSTGLDYKFRGIIAEYCTSASVSGSQTNPMGTPAGYKAYIGTRDNGTISTYTLSYPTIGNRVVSVSKDGSTFFCYSGRSINTSEDKLYKYDVTAGQYVLAYSQSVYNLIQQNIYNPPLTTSQAKLNSDGTLLFVPMISRLVSGGDYNVLIAVVNVGDTSFTYNKTITVNISDTISGSGSRSINDFEISDDLKYLAISVSYYDGYDFYDKSFLFGATTELTFSTMIRSDTSSDEDKNEVENVFLDPTGTYYCPYGYKNTDSYDGSITTSSRNMYYISGLTVTRITTGMSDPRVSVSSQNTNHLFCEDTGIYFSNGGGASKKLIKFDGATMTELGSYNFYKSNIVDISGDYEAIIFAKAVQSSYGLYLGYTYQQLSYNDTGLITGYSTKAQICGYQYSSRGNAFFIDRSKS